MSEELVRAFTAKGAGFLRELIAPIGVTALGDPAPKELSFAGLWDTGATGCAITKKVADAIGAIPTGIVRVGSVHGPADVNEYVVNLHLPNQITISEVEVTELCDEAGCDVLIGMDVMVRGDFAVSNYGGKTYFTFRVPSMENSDYTTQRPNHFQAVKLNKPGRNAPCPCGSGKKFKKCHG